MFKAAAGRGPPRARLIPATRRVCVAQKTTEAISAFSRTSTDALCYKYTPTKMAALITSLIVFEGYFYLLPVRLTGTR